jgi:arylsulfatase A-like enzyme
VVVDSITVPGSVTLERAVNWYQNVAGPAFLWVHFYDAHFPYEPPPRLRQRVLARAEEPPVAVAENSRKLMVLQRGEVELLDELLQQLRAALETKDPGLQSTVVLLAADHGECFGEGGLGRSHQKSLFAATQHIFAVLRPAASMSELPRGVRLQQPTSQVDLLPTLAELAGLPTPEGLQGSSLLSYMKGADFPARGLYMEAFSIRLGERRLQGWVEDGWKYIRAESGDEILYRLAAGEVQNWAARQPERLAAMRSSLEQSLAAMHLVETPKATLTSTDEDALRQLGYLEE